MIENLESIDRWIVLTVNGWNTPWLDEVMWFISGRLTWVPLYLILLYLGFKKLPFIHFLTYVGCVVLAVALADIISVEVFKETILRYRPSHHFELKDKLHLYRLDEGKFYRGGQYGFVSSHAANFFAVAISAGLVLSKYYKNSLKILLIIAVIVSFSRLYLGVHYLTDLLVGGLVGASVGYLVYRFLFLILTKSPPKESNQ